MIFVHHIYQKHKLKWAALFISLLIVLLSSSIAVYGQTSFSVKSYGATGNGTTNDTAAIQKAINAAAKVNGEVYFPAGTYLVTINTTKKGALFVYPNITLRGESNQKAIIKLANKQPNYIALIGGDPGWADISGLKILDLGIDGNSSNNPVTSESQFANDQLRHAIRLLKGVNIRIERVRFFNQNGRQTVSIRGEAADVVVSGNSFEGIGGGTLDYDHSSIYTKSKRIQILNNVFRSKNGAGTFAARTAIEIHGDDHTVEGNDITGYNFGMNVTGIAASSNNQMIRNNIFRDVYAGIVIWATYTDGNTSKPALSNSTITGNTILINVDGWKGVPSAIAGRASGIYLDRDANAPIVNLTITNNRISYGNYSSTSGRTRDSESSGIQIWRVSYPTVPIENLVIKGNQIWAALSSSIHLDARFKNLEVSGNILTDTGSSPLTFSDERRTGIYLTGNTYQTIRLLNNQIIDNRTTNKTKQGIVVKGNCSADCTSSGNTVSIKSGVKVPVFVELAAGVNWILSDTVLPISNPAATETPITPTIPVTMEPTLPPTPTPAAIDPNQPTLQVNVVPAAAAPGQQTIAVIQLHNVTDVYGLQVKCQVDPTVLVGTNHVPGEAFKPDTSFFVNSGYQPDGKWVVAATLLRPNPPISGSMAAFSLVYNVQSGAYTDVACTAVGVDQNGVSIALNVINGAFNGTQPTTVPPTLEPPTPEPPTLEPPTLEPPTLEPPTLEPPTLEPPTLEPPTLEPPTLEPPTPTSLGSISGTVQYQNRPDNAGITVQLINANTVLVELTTNANGSYLFTDVPTGEYQVQLASAGHLSVVRTLVLDASNPALDLGTDALPGGDTDNNQLIDISDAALIGANFGLDGSLVPQADINRDLAIDISDLVLVGSNFGLTGPIAR